ncbi:AAA family ATPase [Nonlabens ulvanivorans]|uniref:AAA family ATPase n=1 Tax=Nonlabens ulvanivorans TaxID=906888 RepID=UPI002941ED68|nr:AAA family ATPase [Nonlabens ulvanivorans]WOI21626.1 AAA family ATPase [Nonlabens ulvanivorans]
MKINLHINQDSYNVNEFYLTKDSWDDWGYKTLFELYYYNENKEFDNIGSVKIAMKGMKSGSTSVPDSFEKLDNDYFSLGEEKVYYENLSNYDESVRCFLLDALNDIAFNEEIYDEVINESVTAISLLRTVSVDNIIVDFRSLANGDAVLSEYKFQYNFPSTKSSIAPRPPITFHVIPNNLPTTNIHVLIGSNGVGKTYHFNNMIDSLLNNSKSSSKYGYFTSQTESDEIFANLVSVSFSAFDDRDPPEERNDKSNSINYSYIGLKRVKSDKNSAPKSTTILKNEFVKGLESILKGAKWKRLKSALLILSSDPVFSQFDFIKVIEDYNFSEIEINVNKEIGDLFRTLSSGHKIVLLTLVRLVDTVEERSLVLLDEPETHLHPPLLSAFMKALSNLLRQRNAVAIIATHSPVVLQEVPKSCVWKFSRVGTYSKAERLSIESYGENLGTLTREVFGFEVTDSGFHKLISEVVKGNYTYNEVHKKFNGELGLEAQSIIRALLNTRNY